MRLIIELASPVVLDGNEYHSNILAYAPLEPHYKAFMLEIKDVVENFKFGNLTEEESHDRIQARISNWKLFADLQEKAIEKDINLVVGSFVLLISYFCYSMKSCTLGTTSTAMIFLSIGPAAFIFRTVLEVEIFSGLNLFFFAFALGIAADDVFVLTGYWKKSQMQISSD